MPEANFFTNFNNILRTRTEGRRSPRVPQLSGVFHAETVTDPHASRQSAPSSPSPLDYLRIVGRRWHIAVAVAALLTTAAGIVTWRVPKLFRAEAILLLDSDTQLEIKSTPPPRPFDATLVRGEIEVLNSWATAEKVVEKLHLHGSAKITEEVRGSIFVQNDGKSPVLRISAKAASPELAAKIANAYADVYLENQIAAKKAAARRAGQWLDRQISGLASQLAGVDQRIATYKAEHAITSTQGTTIPAQELAEINTQIVSAHGERLQEEAALRYARQVLASPGGVEAAGQVLTSPLIQRLREQEADLVRRMADLSTRYKPAHPVMIRAQAELDDVRRKLGEEAARVVRAMGDEAAAARAREETLKANLAELASTTAQQESTRSGLRELEHEADATRTLYESLLARSKENAAQQDLQQPDAQIVSRADPAQVSPWPNKPQMLIASVLLSILLGVSVALLRELLDSSFRRPEDVEQNVGLPVLGIVPTIATPRSGKPAPSKSEAALSEAMRGVRNGLRQSRAGAPLGVMTVTSASAGEGKSFFAVALGRNVARAGLRCVVVDCDFQQPGIENILQPPPAKSLRAPARPGAYPRIQVDGASGLHYIAAPAAEQRRVFRSQDLFESAEMRDYIRRLRGQYDLIILDAPSVQSSAELIALSRLADTSIFVIRWGKTRRQAATEALRALALRGVSLAGIVLSHVDLRRYGTYGYADYVRYLESSTAVTVRQ